MEFVYPNRGAWPRVARAGRVSLSQPYKLTRSPFDPYDFFIKTSVAESAVLGV
jgi:hypothetical protein